MHLCAVQALPASYSWMTLKPAQPTGASPMELQRAGRLIHLTTDHMRNQAFTHCMQTITRQRSQTPMPGWCRSQFPIMLISTLLMRSALNPLATHIILTAVCLNTAPTED